MSIQPLSTSEKLSSLPDNDISKVIIRDANNSAIIAEATFATDVIVDESSYYIDPSTVEMSRLERSDRAITCPYKGKGFWLDLVDDDVRVRDVAWVYTDTNPDYAQFKDRIGFYSRNFRGTLVEVVNS